MDRPRARLYTLQLQNDAAEMCRYPCERDVLAWFPLPRRTSRCVRFTASANTVLPSDRARIHTTLGYNTAVSASNWSVLATIAYGMLGLVLSALYGFCPRLRRERLFHLVTAAVVVVATQIVILATQPRIDTPADMIRSGVYFLLMLTASLCYVPVAVHLALHYGEWFLERILSPARRDESRRSRPLTEVEEIKRCQEILTEFRDRVDVRERLADLYTRQGFFDSAVYEYRRASDWVARGYRHAYILYKAGFILVEKRGDLERAAPILRRIVRLYPKSYFASYARRVLNHLEAHAEDETGAEDGIG